jgi:hypothetical protein
MQLCESGELRAISVELTTHYYSYHRIGRHNAPTRRYRPERTKPELFPPASHFPASSFWFCGQRKTGAEKPVVLIANDLVALAGHDSTHRLPRSPCPPLSWYPYCDPPQNRSKDGRPYRDRGTGASLPIVGKNDVR